MRQNLAIPRNPWSLFIYLFMYWLCCMACGVLIPPPGIELMPPIVEVRVSTTWQPGKSPCGSLGIRMAIPARASSVKEQVCIHESSELKYLQRAEQYDFFFNTFWPRSTKKFKVKTVCWSEMPFVLQAIRISSTNWIKAASISWGSLKSFARISPNIVGVF